MADPHAARPACHAGSAVTAGWLVLLTLGFNLLIADRLTAESTGVLRTRAAAVAAPIDIGADGG